jgi:hypothetical protein
MDETQKRVEAIGDQLRAKISSKFQTVVFLAGFTSAILGVMITLLWSSSKVPALISLSIPLLVFSIFLFFYAVYSLDGLTMPKRFWEEDRTKGSNPRSRLGYLADEDLWALRNTMLFYWYSLAVIAVVVTVVSMILALVPPGVEFGDELVSYTFRNACLAAAGAVIYCVFLEIFLGIMRCLGKWPHFLRLPD